MKTVQQKRAGTAHHTTVSAIPKGILGALGLLKNRPIDGVAYQRRIRREWEQRLKRQWRLGLKRTRHAS